MARRRKFFRIRLPFIRRIKVNRHTFFNIIGFLVIGVSLILLLSFTQSGTMLITVHDYLMRLFDISAFFVPILLFMVGSHFFNSKKLKIIKPHLTLGLFFIFLSLDGALRGGEFGRLIFENLAADFSVLGGMIILAVTFLIGLVVFFNTSIDVFLIMVINAFKGIYGLLKKHVFTGFGGVTQNKNEPTGDIFIQDRKKTATTVPPTGSHLQNPQSSFHVRPLATSDKDWVYPPISLLPEITQSEPDRGDVKKNSTTIEKTLDSFGIRARIAEVNMGPTVTQYALQIVMGTKLSKITALSNDLALALAATTGQVRIEAPIPGRSLVGIEIPNKKPEIVSLKKMLVADIIAKNSDPLTVPLGLDVSGNPQAATLSRMPHALIAGTTGAGKSVLLNSWICSFLFRAKPSEVRFILVDPKRVELSVYNGIPHLLTEVIVEPDKIISALKWTVAEMENRYKQFAAAGARNIESYNESSKQERMPYIIFVIDELADLMVFAPRDVEELITRIAQMARATGIHLVLATQRPSVDVITGLMKANIPARIAFNVASMIDSRVILDMPGAEKLLGRGDMLYLPPDQAKPRRIQSPYLTEKDVQEIVKFLKQQTPVVHYTEEVTQQDVGVRVGPGRFGTVLADGKDPLFEQAIEIVMQFGKASASLLQRRLSVGYARAAKLLDQLEQEGYIGPAEGAKARPVIHRAPVEEEAIPDA